MRGPDTARTARSRDLRRSQTDAESLLWYRLKDRGLAGWKFRRQVPLERFFADFLCAQGKLVVEIDGGQHVGRAVYDAARSARFEEQGYRVLRFWNDEVLNQPERELEVILRELSQSENCPSP